MTNTSPVPDAPPRDSVWTKYSPHHEFPIASTASFALHGLIVAIFFLFWLGMQTRWHGEATQSPKLDVVFVQGPSGDGQAPGGGSDPGTPGKQTEQIDPKEPLKNSFDIAPPPALDAIPTAPFQVRIDVPSIEPKSTADELKNAFAKIEKDFGPKAEPKRAVAPKGMGGGQGGGGVGPGKGSGVGPGNGAGDNPGGATARAEKLAKRWNFNLKGESREHLQKLLSGGIKLGFIDGNNLFWVVQDLKKRPVTYQLEPHEKYKDNAQWINTHPWSINTLSQELGLKGPPRVFVMFLPSDREQIFADAEDKYAKVRNRDIKQITETYFDFRVVGGTIEPVVIGQYPFDPRPTW